VDGLLLLVGIITLIWGVVATIAYVRRPGRCIFDPVSVSWLGYIHYIAGGLILTAIYYPDRPTQASRGLSVILILIATVTYTIGLYVTHGEKIARILPVPAPIMGKTQAWLTLAFGATLFTVIMTTAAVSALVSPIRAALATGAFSTITLVTILIVCGYQRSYITKAMMFLLLVGSILAAGRLFWSRRPVVGMVLAAMGLYYYLRVRPRPLAFRALFLGGMSFSGLLVFLLLTGSRSAWFYGVEAVPMFSRENFLSAVGDVTVNYRVYEKIVEQYAEFTDLHYGSTLVGTFVWYPRRWWPSKPLGTGDVATAIWHGWPVETDVAIRVSERGTGNVSPLPIGEIYMNFGTIGVIILPFIVGILVRTLNSYLRRHRDNAVLWAAWFISVPSFAGEWRGTLNAMTVAPILQTSMFLTIAWVFGKLFGRGSQIMYSQTSLEYPEAVYDQAPVTEEYPSPG